MEHFKPRQIAITISGLTLIILGVAFSYYSSYLIGSANIREKNIEKTIESTFIYEEELLEGVDNFKWSFLKGELDNAIQKANILGNAQVEKIEKELLELGNLEQHFSNFNDNDNPIVAILDKYTRGIYFGLHNDANDPFIMLASLDGEVVIAIDTSGNCATVNENGKVELTRTLEEEMKQQANPSLAFIQLTRIANHDKWSIERPFYFQFTGKDRVLPLEDKDYNLESIEKLFMNSEGDHSYIFRDLEFLVPTYLYDDRDILGVRQVDSRGVFNNDTKIIIYVIAFNFLDYISTQPRIQRELIKLDASKKTIKDSTELKVQKLGSEITATMETIRVFNLARVFLNCLVIVACLGIFSVLRRD